MNRLFITVAALSTATALNAQTIEERAESAKVMYTPAPEATQVASPTTATLDTPMRKGPSGSTIYGFQTYRDEDNFCAGLYELDTHGNTTHLWDYSMYPSIGALVKSAWIRDNKLCGITVVAYGSEDMVLGAAYQEMDLENGNIILTDEYDLTETMLPFFSSAAYRPADDRIYGFGKTGAIEEADYAFKSAPASSPADVTVIAPLELPGYRCPSFCYSPIDDCFYGINVFNKFVRITTEGAITELFDVPVDNLSTGTGALFYSPCDGFLIWNPSQYQRTAALYAIYPSESRVEKLTDFPMDCQFSTFVSPDVQFHADAPLPPVINSLDFDGPATDGSISFTLPQTGYLSTPLADTLQWSVKANGTVLACGMDAPGTEITIPFTALPEDYYTFSVAATSDAHTGYPAVAHRFVGYDTPQAPAEVTLTRETISWQPVARGSHGGYMNAEGVTYEVRLNDREPTFTTECSIPFALPDDAQMAAYRAYVTAVADDRRSEPGVSDKLIAGKPFDLPYTMIPTAEQAELVITENRDGSPEYGEWRYSEAWGDPVFASGWSKEPGPDDWLILPAINIPDHTVAYRVTLDAARGSYIGSKEYFEVWAGTEPKAEAMTIPVIAKTRARTQDWKDYTNLFAVPRAGTYYIAVRCCSDEDQKDLIVKNIRIEATDELLDIPMAVTDLEEVSLDHAALTATIGFNMPQTYINGNPISEPLSVVVKGITEVTIEGEPGSHQTATVGTRQGDNVITVTPVSADMVGQQSEIMVWTGMDLLMYVEDYTASLSEDNLTAHLEWSAPIESLNGGYFSQTGNKYWVTPVLSDGSVPEGVEMQLAGTDVFSYDYTVPDDQLVDYVRLAVIAENAAGLSPARWYIGLTIGKPHAMPIYEDWHTIAPTYKPMTITTSGAWSGSAWTVGQPELVNQAYAHDSNPYTLIGYTDEASARARITLPKFSTAGNTGVRATFDLWTGFNSGRDMTILATTYGAQPVVIASIPDGEGWKKCDVYLPEEYLNRSWVSLLLDGYLDSHEHFILLSNYRIEDVSGVALNTAISTLTHDGHILTATGCTIEVFSLQGLRVLDGTDAVATTDLTPGIYTARATDGYHSEIMKFRVK